MQRTESLPSKRTMAMPHPCLSPPPPCFGSAAYGVNATTPPNHHHLLLPPAKMPFTVTQWQELERQKMIYKYMTSSVPVPTELLLPPIIPTVKAPSDLVSSQSQSQSNTSGGLELKFSRSSDPEPWRCRRTDGKKWRCSRDVTPDQKYCERHAHKNRPRSRKPVESQTHNPSNSNSNSVSLSGGILSNNTLPATQVFQFSSSSAFGQTQKRSTNDWLSSYGQVQQWQQFHEEGEVDHDDICGGGEERRLVEISQNWVPNDDQYLSYISSGNSNQMMTTRHFIDAWPSSSSTDHQKDHQNMVLNGDQDNGNVSSQLGIAILTQSPWMPSHDQPQPGGPLGEALCHNNKNAGGGGGKSFREDDDGLGFPF